MSTTLAGSWSGNGNLNPSSPYWGLTRVVGPSRTTRVDVEKSKSVPGKFYANAADWFTPMNPGLSGESQVHMPRPKWQNQDNGVFLTEATGFETPIGYSIPRVSPRGTGGKKVVGYKGTGMHTPRMGVADNESAEQGSLGKDGEEVQPARKQNSPRDVSVVKRKNPAGLSVDLSFKGGVSKQKRGYGMFSANSRKGSPVTASANSGSMMSMDSPNFSRRSPHMGSRKIGLIIG
jgi:hypothetical protein